MDVDGQEPAAVASTAVGDPGPTANPELPEQKVLKLCSQQDRCSRSRHCRRHPMPGGTIRDINSDFCNIRRMSRVIHYLGEHSIQASIERC